jgi:predicted transcriptional regulator
LLKRRSRLEVCMDILQAVSNGVSRRTRIMQTTNTNWHVMIECLNALVECGLITPVFESGRHHYFITEKGFTILNKFKEIKQLLGKID